MGRQAAAALALISLAAAGGAAFAAWAGARDSERCRAPLERFASAVAVAASAPGTISAARAAREKDAAGIDILDRGCPSALVVIGEFAGRDAARRLLGVELRG